MVPFAAWVPLNEVMLARAVLVRHTVVVGVGLGVVDGVGLGEGVDVAVLVGVFVGLGCASTTVVAPMHTCGTLLLLS